jgi:nitrogen-specific signal transduction histidine kinase
VKHSPALGNAAGVQAGPLSLRQMSGVFKHIDDADSMIESMVQGITSCIKVARVGLFAYNRVDEVYSYRAGVKCLSDTQHITVSREDPLIYWMKRHAHLVSRTHLDVIEAASDRSVLRHSLEMMGAEIIIPLFGRNTLLGWLFVGHRITGIPFSQPELEGLMQLGEQAAITLENQELYERVAMQKALADTVFDSMPVGVVAIGVDGHVRWLNAAAQDILDVIPSDIVKQPIAKYSSQLAGMMMQRIDGDSFEELYDWADPRTKRSLSVLTRRLESASKCIGAIAIIRDLTQERQLRVKEEEVERASFWTELAAAMSHEVRNPLVAISTFAQLLPERYADPDFRDKFSELVRSEISRLNAMVDQISDFAETPSLHFEPIRIADVIHQAIRTVTADPAAAGILVEASIDDNLPEVLCDRNALSECFAHLIRNAVECVAKAQYPAVHVTVMVSESSGGNAHVKVNIMDNGAGIQNEIRDKLFSPFCTTKARGIGLGLPIARRTVTDHGGTLAVETTQKGTSVEVILPVRTPAVNNAYTPTPAMSAHPH